MPRLDPVDTHFTTRIQQSLHKAEGTPVVGPLLVSPVLALISLIQTVAYFAIGLFVSTLATLFSKNGWLREKADLATGVSIVGFVGLFASCLNMTTLGLSGYRELHSATRLSF